MSEKSELTLLELACEKFGELNGAEKKLFTLAQETFSDLTDSEYTLFRAIANGKPADYRVAPEEHNNLDQALNWGMDRTLRADHLRWLCIEPEVWKLCLLQGIDVSGAKIEGSLNLSLSEVNVPLRCFQCYFTEVLQLRQTKLRTLDLSGTRIASSKLLIFPAKPPIPTSIYAIEISMTGSVWLGEDFQALGMVILNSATIGGNLDCAGGKFTNQGNEALVVQSANVTGYVRLGESFQALGSVFLHSATIGGDLNCSGGEFTNPDKDALVAVDVNVKGYVYLDKKFQATGSVNLFGATIGGGLDCSGGKFTNQDKDALLAQNAKVTRLVCLREGFEAIGRVSLLGATIGGDLDCTGGKFTNQDKDALVAIDANISGYVFLREKFQAVGAVILNDATIRGDLDCSGGGFTNGNKTALYAADVNVKGDVSLSDGFEAVGAVILNHAMIGGDLDCYNGKFVNEGEFALVAQSIDVKGNVSLRDSFQAAGIVSLCDAKIGKTLEIARIKAPQDMALDLQFAQVRTLEQAEDSFPLPGHLLLNNLVYEALGSASLQNRKQYITWLRLQPKEFFSSQPYEQLAKVLRSVGEGDEAVKVLIGREDDLLQRGNLHWFSKGWKRFLGCTIAYGYHPEWALIWGLIVVVAGSFLFNVGYQNGLISATDKDCKPPTLQQVDQACPNHPKFNPIIYSLDVFLPIIDLRLKTYWLPNANKGTEVFQIKWGALLRYYFWIHILLGWVLTTLWVAAFSGLVRNSNK